MTREEAEEYAKSKMSNNCGVYLGGGKCSDNCKVIEAIKALEQEPRWISVSERLPKSVNVGALWKREVLITGYLSFDDKKKRFVATEHIDNVISKKDVNDVHVVAWMPLPAPFEPQESEDKCVKCINNGLIDDECSYCTNYNLFKAESEG